MNFKIRSRLFIENGQIHFFIPVSHSKIDFCGVQKQKGKLVFSKSGLFHIWHMVSSVAQGQNDVNWPRYEIYVMKISVSPEKRKIVCFFFF